MNFIVFKHRLHVGRRLVSAKLNRILGPVNLYFRPEKLYDIKAGYQHAKSVEIFDDRLNTDQWQNAVYETANSILLEIKGESVIDVGCGSAFKLIRLFGNLNTTGIEIADTYQWLLKTHPTKKWIDFAEAKPSQLQADLVICADVIEHVSNPDDLMNFLQEIYCRRLVISTPERNRVRGNKDFGPPENSTHYREWDQVEFYNYVSKWFTVLQQFISADKSASQILICKTSV